MSFIWFWTFWHWNTESFRCGSLLRGPLHGIGSHWDEWFRHEASEDDRRAIESAGRSEPTQRRFILWLVRRWGREANGEAHRPASRFVLGQLALVPPFNRWRAFEPYGERYGVGGIPAIVLAETSSGEPTDVRPVEALALAADPDRTAPALVPEGFQADGAELDDARGAALSLLRGRGLAVLLALWIATGRRPYPRGLRIALGLGWLVAAGMILRLIAGPDPGDDLVAYAAALSVIWGGLALTGIGTAAWQSFRAWRQGRRWGERLQRSQVRLRMSGGLTLKGGSAGFAFCLNALLSLYTADPRAARGSWLWQRFFRRLRSEAGRWAATGVIAADGRISPVVLEAKLRACLQEGTVLHVLTPRQSGAGRRAISGLADAQRTTARQAPMAPGCGTSSPLGLAAERPRLRGHRCGHLAQSAMAVGGLSSACQAAANAVAVIVSAAMLIALPDLRCILLPPVPPIPRAPSSPSPYSLWVSLDTKHPDRFQAVLHSEFWANRRAQVKHHGGADAPARAEMFLHRVAKQTTLDEENGTLWVERRQRFLTREFAPGEYVGRYSLSYLNHLGHE